MGIFWFSLLDALISMTFILLLHRCFLKLGEWQLSLQGINESTIPKVLQYYSHSTEHDRNWYKVSPTAPLYILTFLFQPLRRQLKKKHLIQLCRQEAVLTSESLKCLSTQTSPKNNV